jgi:hypothetical protein
VIGLEPARGIEQRIYRELLYAMERARSRLAVAIAAESKTTTRDRWRHYLETEDRMRWCVRKIRRLHVPGTGGNSNWREALSLLQQPLPAIDENSRGEAQELCRRLQEVLEIVGSQANEE